jgi:hypothetical protein
MFVIDATGDFTAAVRRLARLMYNIECGVKAYEWLEGSGPAPLPAPEPGLLTIEVPGVTVAAPPVQVDFRPSVGFVYYVPGGGFDVRGLVRALQKALERSFPDDHLVGHLPVEVSPHATLYHHGRTHRGSETKTRAAYTKGWYYSEDYPARYFHTIYGEADKLPSHVSFRGGFTWYFAPVGLVVGIGRIASFAAFNALVASVFFDTFLGGREAPEPIHGVTAAFFDVAPLPELPGELPLGRPQPPSVMAGLVGGAEVLIHRAGRFFLAGPNLRGVLGAWHDPDAEGRRSAALDVLNVGNLPPLGARSACGLCGLPLWGDIYAVGDRLIAPFRMGVCEWCCGCLPPDVRASAVKTRLERPRAEAYRRSAYEPYLPLLEAEVERVAVDLAPASETRVFYVTTLKSGDCFILEPSDGYKKATPPCLRFPELRERRVSSQSHPSLADVS